MKKCLVLLSLLTLLSACGRFGNKDEKPDDITRMVCVSKQYNEIIFALGADSTLVAVDLTSSYPPEAKKLPNVGYHRALSAEAILALKPSILVHDNNVGPEQVMKQLNDLKIPMKTFSHTGEDIASADSLIREMGAYFHKERSADSLCRKLDADMQIAAENTKHYSDTPKVVIIHFGQASNVYLAISSHSVGGKMIEWAGGKIAVGGERGMMPLSPELIASADPDIILLTDFGYDRLGSAQKIMELPGIASTRAARNGRIFRIEEHDLVYLGPRTGENVLKFQKLLHELPAKQ